jgi:hypothetical protein
MWLETIGLVFTSASRPPRDSRYRSTGFAPGLAGFTKVLLPLADRDLSLQGRLTSRQLPRQAAGRLLDSLVPGDSARGQSRHARYHSAFGSARDTLACLEVALVWLTGSASDQSRPRSGRCGLEAARPSSPPAAPPHASARPRNDQLHRAPLQEFLRGRPRCGSPFKIRLEATLRPIVSRLPAFLFFRARAVRD